MSVVQHALHGQSSELGSDGTGFKEPGMLLSKK